MDIKTKKFVESESWKIKVGDIVKMNDGDTFTADFAVLATSGDGECFITTSSLDGEKNLKKRGQVKDFDKVIPNNDKNESQLSALLGMFYILLPDKDLHRFDGYFYINNTQYTTSEKQLLLKGA